MTTIDPTNIVKGGKVCPHPGAGLFRAYLHGRKPSLILAFGWFIDDIGWLVDFQSGLLPEPIRQRRAA